MNIFKQKFSIPVKGISINFSMSFVLFLILIAYAENSILQAIIIVASVIAHEYGHLFVSRKLGYSCNEIFLTFWGGYVSPTISKNEKLLLDEYKNIIHDWKLSIAGPVVNILISAILYFIIYLSNIKNDILDNTAYLNMILGVTNLLPIIGLDGWHIMRYILAKRVKYPTRLSITLGLCTIGIILISLSVRFFIKSHF